MRLFRKRRQPDADQGHSILPFVATPERRASLVSEARTDLEKLFYRGSGRPVLKWAHYLPLYDQHFSRFRGTDVGMLEIGVFQGGSLDLWREFFGPEARIVGLDIDPTCSARVSAPNRVVIGSQDDPEILTQAVAEVGRLDIVLDDGSHFGVHQRASFEHLFRLLVPGGLYVIEDLHTSYWADYAGGPREPTSGIGLIFDVIDSLHSWYYESEDPLGLRDWVPAVHVYDSIVFIEKVPREQPLVVESGLAPEGGRAIL